MNRLLILPVLLLTLLVGTPASSADFQKGLTAYESGDYATALREWEPLAKQGYNLVRHQLYRESPISTHALRWIEIGVGF
jgi:hypothetical protein